MSEKYYIITYVWERQDIDITANMLHKGTIGEWMIDALKQPEFWRLINATEISADEFEQLDGHVG